jgi:hypothetical protein
LFGHKAEELLMTETAAWLSHQCKNKPNTIIQSPRNPKHFNDNKPTYRKYYSTIDSVLGMEGLRISLIRASEMCGPATNTFVDIILHSRLVTTISFAQHPTLHVQNDLAGLAHIAVLIYYMKQDLRPQAGYAMS